MSESRAHFITRFNSRTPGGVRPRRVRRSSFSTAFQFTHPGRGATLASVLAILDSLRFNSRTPGGVRLYAKPVNLFSSAVSIHAPREGCDVQALSLRSPDDDVSIHAPREGCDTESKATYPSLLRFQFTHPGRGATVYQTPCLRS